MRKGEVRPWLPPRRKDAHKGDFGHVLVVAGSREMPGAARLCAMGALRGGAGLVTLAVPEGGPVPRTPWEAMTLPLPSAGGAFAPRAARVVDKFIRERRVTSVALGPGLTSRPGAAALALSILRSCPAPVVADADALNALAASRRFPGRKAPWVVTPHAGEAARLLRATVRAVQADRPGSARRLAEVLQAVAVLKGAGTCVTDGSAFFENSTGNPAMAAGGMGDVLTGLIAALIAQVAAPSPEAACLRAAVLGVFLHGRAGDRAAREVGPAGLAASDVAARLPAAFKDLWRG